MLGFTKHTHEMQSNPGNIQIKTIYSDDKNDKTACSEIIKMRKLTYCFDVEMQYISEVHRQTQ